MTLPVKHCLSGAELSKNDIQGLIALALKMKQDKSAYRKILQDKTLALIFEKPSLRTRFSFTVAMQELGGQLIEHITSNGKSETPEDQIRVIQGYCDALMIRTHTDEIFDRMSQHATIPIINGLSEDFHPCQSLADLMTLQEVFGKLDGLTLCYIGDGNNVLHSLLMMGSLVGVTIHYCCPQGHEPKQSIIDKFTDPQFIKAFDDPIQAVEGCDAVYADVWTSMGCAQKNEVDFSAYQVNESLMSAANDDAIFMHCMPMERGKEVSATLPDAPCSVIFTQSENRLHAQKALLMTLVSQYKD